MKMTMEELVVLANTPEEIKTVEIAVSEDNKTITATQKNLKTVARIIENSTDSMEDRIDATKMLIYQHCDCLHAEVLQKGCTEPVDIVDKIFRENFNLMDKAANKILDMYGLGADSNQDDNVVDAVKN